MNYIELINLFWQTRRRVRLSSVEADLYFFLLQECNTQNWENPFECPNGLICVSIGMSEPTLIDARNRLQQKGFIEFVKGKRRAQSPVYTLLNLNNFSKNFSKSFSKNFSKTHSKTADTPLIGEKQKQKQKPPISPPKSEDAELPLETSGNGDSGSTVNSEKTNIASKPDIDKSADSPMASKHTIPENRTEAAGISNEIPDAVNLSPEGEIGKNKAQKTDVRFFAEVVKFYNDTCQSLRPVKILTDKRRAAVSARLREHGREAVFNVIRAAGRSSFLAGQNTRGWTADFDWIFRPENFVKVLEGKYENKEKSQQYGTESNRQINERLVVGRNFEVF